ncbi:N-acetylglucosaminyldiphosphodolichol N-acetylglucosaminyltransferase [Saliniradius amylolyticus]|uniref:N-acetylglucosaminyldiphosphodolichol N-acetylglucosaminyltransferase n=1 Tax=Saliniradius amylolyticus TaxID=2183582 RepID=A0A2S2E0T0_9ALTE|nr:PssE/Cps14G family polysaccharide biosynthesis glycosyltransferase [Saliniradius amylolyticus]AWL11248.1 N-acetylglucosaminyldiphosphodolichol N-acetylglucosaminyltransferase [Saliniradius amylolyticus]
MRVLVTVGTTTFNGLFRHIDNIAGQLPELEFVCQIANGDYEPRHCKWFRFSQNIENEYKQSDVVITHAGAGSVYQLLEMEKVLIVVPNLERKDQHQLDLARYVGGENYALVANNASEILTGLRKIKQGYKPTPYQKESFFIAGNIREFLGLQ